MKPISIKLETKTGKKIKLTLDEAIELWIVLNNMFGLKYCERLKWPHYPLKPWITFTTATDGTNKETK